MWPNPTLSLAGARAEPVFSAGLALRLPIFGQRGAHIAAAKLGVDHARLEVATDLLHLRHEARIAYYAALRAEEELRIAIDVENLTAKVAAMAKERFDVGSGTRLDSEQATLLHVRSQQDVSDRKAIAFATRVELERTLGSPDARTAPLIDALETVGETPLFDELLHAADTNHPALRALGLEHDAATQRGRAARADRRPVPSAEIGLDVLEPSTCGGTQRCVGPRGALSLDLPLFNWNGGPVALADAEAHTADARRVAAHQRIEAGLRSAYTALEAARARTRFYDVDYLPAATRVEAMAREAFAAGRTGILPLIEAERSMLDARMGRVGALFAVQSARADLEEASGVPLSTP
jgi:cobalt-zinc-cadmium efflux system outer membrane protein